MLGWQISKSEGRTEDGYCEILEIRPSSVKFSDLIVTPRSQLFFQILGSGYRYLVQEGKSAVIIGLTGGADKTP